MRFWDWSASKKLIIMKKTMSILFLLLLSISVCAQQKDVTRFLDIPIDGSKSEMICKLKAKGFESNPYDKETLTGEFNGVDVNVHVVTNNNKVYRIFVADAVSQSVGDIVVRFNNLCRQFENNGKYAYFEDFTISDDEDVRYEMTVNNKRYEAIYYQVPSDTAALINEIRTSVMKNYTEEQISKFTDEQKNEIQEKYFELLSEKLIKRPVWFRIGESYGEYNILMY